MIYTKGQFSGGVELGIDNNMGSDSVIEATQSLVFMAVGLNGHWKVLIGYFLIAGLTGSERGSLLKRALELIQDTGAQIYSVTFDGAPSNFTMCKTLGANFNYFSKDFKPWFLNPFTQQKIWVFLHACHMVKLVRNTLGDWQCLIDGQRNLVKWEYLSKLLELQGNEGLHAGTKLTQKHINFDNNRMNVKLATQTFSVRVFNAFQFVDAMKMPGFEQCMPTAEFCLVLNNICDLLNYRNKFARHNKFNIPIEDSSYEFLKKNAQQFEVYISGLQDRTGRPILQTKRKVGFLGLIICLRNVFELRSQLRDCGLPYLLTFKLSQAFLETFFSAIRSRGGFNNNPNAKQFETAYKRLLIRHEIYSSEAANCLSDGIEILHVSSRKKNFDDPVTSADYEATFFDHDYLQTLWTLTPYVENVVDYIAGFVVKKIMRQKHSLCHVCSSLLSEAGLPSDVPLMISIKKRGTYVIPYPEVRRICRIAEHVIRQHLESLFKHKNIKSYLITQTFRSLDRPFNSKEMDDHIKIQDILDNHRSQLTKLVIELFIDIRLYHEISLKNENDVNIRQKYTKLILFKNQ